MLLPNVGKPSFFYTLVYRSVSLYYRLYYRSFTIIGRENIPRDKPVIYAGNHQNALMDALSILFAANGRVAFLARADMFKKKPIAAILFFFRILPIYRIRDGISTMGQNEASFKMAAEVLKNGTPLALFPEGNHSDTKRLRTLKKGICRIAFMAEESADFSLDIHIVPAGIDYSNYSDPGARLMVQYGKPIKVADFVPLYRENPQKALSALRDSLSKSMSPLIVHIANEEYYPEYLAICNLCRQSYLKKKGEANTHPNRLKADQDIISSLDKKLNSSAPVFEAFRGENKVYQELLEKHGLRDWLVQKNKVMPVLLFLNLLASLILLPVHLYGLLLNYLPYKLPTRLTRNVEDHVFLSSLHFGIGLLLFPIYYLLVLAIFCLFTKGLLIKFLFGLSLPLSGYFTFHFYIHLLKLRGKLRFLILRLTNKPQYHRIIEARQNLVNRINEIIYSN
ncbi:MAG: 1-acyl-sn-glycerol-3-phosphate acyltransferase [Bacteroidetes bacterium]|nr:1-acyl-sn-glycerol-3-phosphate acyltransferase [Bacteroidota bacterium]